MSVVLGHDKSIVESCVAVGTRITSAPLNVHVACSINLAHGTRSIFVEVFINNASVFVLNSMEQGAVLIAITETFGVLRVWVQAQ